MGQNKTIRATKTEKLYNYLKYNARISESFEIMSQNSAKMEKIAKNYKKLYESCKNHLENLAQ